MQKRQERTIDAHQDVLIYLEQHPITPEPPLLREKRESLQASITRIEWLATEQRSAAHSISGRVRDRVSQLRSDWMLPLKRIAAGLLEYAPKVEAALRVPHAKAAAHTVATAGLRMADALAPHWKLLKSAGYSKAEMRDFRREAKQLALVTEKAASARQRSTKATKAIADEFKKAAQTVTVIEGMVMHHVGRDKAKLKHWKNRRRVSARIGRPRTRGKKSSGP